MILKTEKAMVTSMLGIDLHDKRNTKKLMELFGANTIGNVTKESAVRMRSYVWMRRQYFKVGTKF